MGALVIIGYLMAHFAVFVAWLRQKPSFEKESHIAAYHIVSFGILIGTLTIAALVQGDSGGFALDGLAVGLHGIYSLSFLELWSLTEGSYSLSLLMRINSSETGITVEQLSGLKNIGTTKLAARHESLRRLGLVSDDPVFALTCQGRVCSRLLTFVIWLSNGQTMN